VVIIQYGGHSRNLITTLPQKHFSSAVIMNYIIRVLGEPPRAMCIENYNHAFPKDDYDCNEDFHNT
jgi:hypothetical protein